MKHLLMKWAITVAILTVTIMVMGLIAFLTGGNIGALVGGGALGVAVMHIVDHEFGDAKK